MDSFLYHYKFGQDLQDFVDALFYFFPEERNKDQSASRKWRFANGFPLISSAKGEKLRLSAPWICNRPLGAARRLAFSRFLQETVTKSSPVNPV
jgi:hypothetical protein